MRLIPILAAALAFVGVSVAAPPPAAAETTNLRFAPAAPTLAVPVPAEQYRYRGHRNGYRGYGYRRYGYRPRHYRPYYRPYRSYYRPRYYSQPRHYRPHYRGYRRWR